MVSRFGDILSYWSFFFNDTWTTEFYTYRHTLSLPDALPIFGGAPGLYSARYAGGHGDAQANIDKLLDALREVPDERRGAHFHAAIVLLRHAEDPQPLI